MPRRSIRRGSYHTPTPGSKGRSSRPELVAVVLTSVVLAFSLGGCSNPDRTESEKAVAPRKIPEGRSTTIDRTETRKDLSEHLRLGWWNRPSKIELLGLTVEQREQLDEIVLAHLEEESVDDGFRNALEGFGQAIEAGDRDRAGKQADRMTELLATSQRRQIQVVIDGTALLTQEQILILAERFPGLLRRPWIHTKALREGGPESIPKLLSPPGSAQERGQG